MLLATRSWLPVGDSPPAWVTTSPLANAEWEAPYTQTLLATGANTYTLAGSLPPGITLAGDMITGMPSPAPSAPAWTTSAGSLGTAAQGGELSMTLAATGAVEFVVRAGLLPWGVRLDAATGALAGTLAVIGGPEDSPGPAPVWSTAAGSFGTAWEGQAASFALSASGASQFEIVGGVLPWGLRLDRSTGALTGTPADVGGAVLDPLETYTWSAPVSSDLGTFAVGASVSIAQATVPEIGLSYLLSGVLPWGLILNRSTGLISGTVGVENAPGAYTFTVAKTLPDGSYGSRAYTITIV